MAQKWPISSLRAQGTLISEPRFSTPARCDFSRARKGKRPFQMKIRTNGPKMANFFFSIVFHILGVQNTGWGIWYFWGTFGCGFFAYSWKLPAFCGAFLLAVDNFSFFTYCWSFFTYSWSFFAYSGTMHLIRALRDCKHRSSTVSRKAPTVSKKASPEFFILLGSRGFGALTRSARLQHYKHKEKVLRGFAVKWHIPAPSLEASMTVLLLDSTSDSGLWTGYGLKPNKPFAKGQRFSGLGNVRRYV